MEWVYSSEVGKDYVTNKLGFISPFNTFTESPSDPLAREVMKYMSNEELTSVSWNFTAFPSQTFKDHFGTYLLEYSREELPWSGVVTNVKAEWKAEKGAK